MTTIERRYTPGAVELRAAGDGDDSPGTIGGYAIRFGKYSRNLGGFVERVQPGAVAKTLADGGDVLARFQHDDRYILGRTSAGTVDLRTDADGLDYTVPLPATSYARDLAALAKRGDVRHSSFAFRTMPGGDEWSETDEGFPLRDLTEIALIDVAPVVQPAYLDASAGLRSLAEQRGLDLDAVTRAAEANALAELLRSGAPTVIDLGTTSTTGNGTPGAPHVPLSVRRARLDLIARG